MSNQVTEPASKFMHAQTTIAGLRCCAILCSLIFGLIIVHQFKDVAETPGTVFHNSEVHMDTLKEMAKEQWVGALSSGVSLCIGSVVMFAVAHCLIQNRHTCGLKLCWLTEGLCSCLGCLEGCSYCILFFMLITAVVGMNDPVTFCQHVTNTTEWQAFYTTPAPVTTVGGTPPPATSCEQYVALLEKPVLTFAIGMLVAAICACKIAVACASGMKFGKDTCEALEDEEYGGFDSDQYY